MPVVRYVADGLALVSIPMSWTSLRSVDDFEHASSGRCFFRVDDLVALRELVDSLLGVDGRCDQK